MSDMSACCWVRVRARVLVEDLQQARQQLAQAAGVPSDPALYAHLQVVRAHGEMHGAHSCDRGDKIGVLRALAAQGRYAHP